MVSFVVICNTFKNEKTTKIVKTEVGSFRLNKDVLYKLKKEAEAENLSLNSLVNKVLGMHVRWHSIVGKLGIIPIGANVLMELFKNLSDDEIKKLARKQVPIISENLLLLRQEDTIEAFLDVVKDYFTVCGFLYSLKEKNGNIKVTVHHTLGKKYSLYNGEIFTTKIEQLTKKKADVSITTNTITFSIDLKVI